MRHSFAEMHVPKCICCVHLQQWLIRRALFLIHFACVVPVQGISSLVQGAATLVGQMRRAYAEMHMPMASPTKHRAPLSAPVATASSGSSFAVLRPACYSTL